ncbi:MAG: nucleoside 2-deoxyribosyltransferase [Betaproteobacteria bacterium]|nr:nucleoside 2-deoxyribosyltransferase [Betaproteobacteria bacterium]
MDLVERGVTVPDAYASIFERDIEALKECDLLLLVLDGRTIDEGAAFELGFAHAYRKTCVGLQTDPRRLLPLGNNPMLAGALDVVFSHTGELCSWL